MKYPLRPYLGFNSIAWDWEVLAAFFELHNVKPKFIICDTWGILNYTTGQFTAAVGMIQRDEVDVAAAGFAVMHSRSKVAEYTQGVTYFVQQIVPIEADQSGHHCVEEAESKYWWLHRGVKSSAPTIDPVMIPYR